MAILNFMKGEYSLLPKTYKEGTVYVTTDEKAMYIDISDSQRIRLGQIVTVDTVEAWEGLKPPFSHEAFYYIKEGNALFKNNGTAESPNWVQINSTADVLAKANEALTAANTAQTTAEAAGTAAAAAQGTANEAKAAAEAAQSTANTGVANAATAQTRADDAYALAEQAKSAADAADSKAAGAQSTADAANTAAGAAQTRADNAYTLAEQAKSAADAADGKAADAQDAADAAQADATKALSDAANAQSAAEGAQSTADAANTAAGEAKNLANAAQDAADAAQADATQALANAAAAKTAADNAQADATQALADAAAAKAAADAAQSTADGAATAAGNAQTTANSALEIANNAVSVNNAQNDRLTAIEEQVGLSTGDGTSLATKVANLESTITNEDTGLGAAHTKIDAINTALADYAKSADVENDIAAAEDRMSAAIESAIAENDAMTYKGVVTVDDEGNDNLPTVADGIKIGDTYKVARDGYYDGILCYVGDLLIANSTTGKEDENGVIADGNLKWDHIESGYEDSNQPTLSADGNNIYLTSAVADEANKGDLGKISIVSMSDSLKVTVAGNQINLSLEWGDFPAQTTT